jgi:hypothetical protein
METPGEEERLRAHVRHVLEQLKQHLKAERLELGWPTLETEKDKNDKARR